MDLNIANELLEISHGSTIEQIEKNYKEKFNNISAQIVSAPNHMKAIYEKNLNDLNAAYQLAINSSNGATNKSFLVSDTKIIEQIEDNKPQSNVTNIQQGNNVLTNPKSTSNNESSILDTKNGKFLFWGLIFSLALASFLGLKWYKASKELEENTKFIALGKVASKGLKNRDFYIENIGETPFTVLGYKVLYLDEKNFSLKVFQKNDLNKEVGIRGKITTREREGNADEFLGQALFYALFIQDNEGNIRQYNDTLPEKGGVLLSFKNPTPQ